LFIDFTGLEGDRTTLQFKDLLEIRPIEEIFELAADGDGFLFQAVRGLYWFVRLSRNLLVGSPYPEWVLHQAQIIGGYFLPIGADCLLQTKYIRHPPQQFG
jgi:hypothetical protein